MENNHAEERVPLTILTGYLGSGKTTLLNRLLTEETEKKSAVIVNEFGDIGIDHQLIHSTEEEIIEMNNGCICCTVRGDLVDILHKLFHAKQTGEKQFDRIIIETTGLADPAPVIQTFILEETLRDLVYIDSVITVVDSRHIDTQLNTSEEAHEQIALADVVLLNKKDLVEKERLSLLKSLVLKMNPTADCYETSHTEVNLDQILGRQSFDLNKKLQIHPAMLNRHHHHEHSSITTFTLREEAPMDLEKIEAWIDFLIKEKGEDLLRYKGILNIAAYDVRVVFQGIHMLFASKPDRRWKEEEIRATELVFIGRNLSAEMLRKGFQLCVSSQAEHTGLEKQEKF